MRGAGDAGRALAGRGGHAELGQHKLGVVARWAPGSFSVVVPLANTPASSTAVFSWADAMGRVVGDGDAGRGACTP